MGNETDNKAKIVKCPKCPKDLRHESHTLDGTNKRGDITGNLFEAINKFNKFDHFFYRKVNESRKDSIIAIVKEVADKKWKSLLNAKKKLYLSVPDEIEGHHLITIGAVDDNKKENGPWYKLFYQYGYNINCPQNGVLLPGDMLVACHFGVPLHKGRHEAGAILEKDVYQWATEKNYIASVRDLVKNMKTDYKCKNCKKIPAEKIKEFHRKMMNKSQLIFRKVRQFQWLITSDGMHYQKDNSIGCYDDCRTLSQKRRLMSEEIGIKKKFGEKVAEFVIEKLAKTFAGKGCKDRERSRDHTIHGCSQKSDLSWDACRYNEMDEEINKLTDD